VIRTHLLPCHLPDAQCRTLNRESGRIYSETLVHHYRIYRNAAGLWLSPMQHNRVLDSFCGPSALLHSHSVDAAQQDFYEACKTAKALRQINPRARFPYKRKYYHTTTWKNTAIKMVDGRMRLSLAQGQPYLWLDLPEHLATLPANAFRQVQLCYNHATKANTWHLTVEDAVAVQPTANTGIMAVDMGEIVRREVA
jgi:putative transposase